jgi:arylsulfatase A-like enzyme
MASPGALAARRGAFLLAALCGLALAAACGGRGRAAGTIALLDELPQAELTWPDGTPPPAGDALVPFPAFVGRPHPREPRALGRVRRTIGGERDERTALLLPPGGSVRFALELPRRPRLRTGLAALAPLAPLAPDAEPLVVSVRLTPEGGGEAATLFERALLAPAEAGWEEVVVALDAWAGERVALELGAAGGSPESLAAWAVPRVEDAAPPGPRPSVVLVSLDTLRADRLGSYGYRRRPTSPHLDAFAASNLRFEQAIAQAPWTKPSHRSLLTGLYPSDRSHRGERFLAVPLLGAGYRTLAATGGGQLDSRFGFGAGFEVYRTEEWLEAPERLVERVARETPEPFFLFLHTYATHEPYRDARFAAGLPRGRIGAAFTKRLQQRLGDTLTEEEKRYAEALYDGGIAAADERLGRFFAAAERAGWFERAIVVVTSDHGEQFWEHGTWGHGQTLHDHQLRVPLLVSLPRSLRRDLGAGRAARRAIGDLVRSVDLYPTLLELTGTPLPGRLAGRSLRPLLAGQRLPPAEAFAENVNLRAVERKALRTARYKFVHTFPRRGHRDGYERFELFDLGRDPGETANLAGEQADLVRALLARIARHRRGGSDELEEEVPEELDRELRERLEALGYLGG